MGFNSGFEGLIAWGSPVIRPDYCTACPEGRAFRCGMGPGI